MRWLALLLCVLTGCAGLHRSDFIVELEDGGMVEVGREAVIINVPAGATVWFRHKLASPVTIDFLATPVSAGGPHDRVSDLNVFWMASNADGSSPLSTPRTGRFADYDTLRTYYAGIGGNSNTTTRFRRYIGQPGTRPLLPEHDLRDKAVLLKPNQRHHVRLTADGGRIECELDGRTLFALQDPDPYLSGWFAFRTVHSHIRIESLRIDKAR
jgi:hypothetical protein